MNGTETKPKGAPVARLGSVDAYRGFVMFLMYRRKLFLRI